jgi:aspartyl-tRNA(Asn)/glutamyl-tRNA(Gln) amidotransferase subunit C
MVSIEEIKHLEDLSKLEFTDEERVEFQKSFDSIVEFASQIQGANVEDNVSFIKTIKMEDLREDEIGKSLSQDEVVTNAPNKKKGCFVVPRIMD